MQHPEDYCHKCGGPNITWFAPSPIWNKSVREHGEKEILCPVCFVQLAEAAGFNSAAWRLAPQGYLDSPLVIETVKKDEREHIVGDDGGSHISWGDYPSTVV